MLVLKAVLAKALLNSLNTDTVKLIYKTAALLMWKLLWFKTAHETADRLGS